MLKNICCISTDSCKGSCIGLSRNQNVKLTYIVIFLLLMGISYFKNKISTHSEQEINLEQLQKYHCQQMELKYQTDCILQKKLTLDFSGLGIFFLIIFLLIIPKTKNVKIINQGLWILKLLFLIGIVLTIDLTFGPSISQYLQTGSIWLSPILYLLMNIIIIDNIYLLDFKFIQWSEKNRRLHVVKVLVSILVLICAVGLNVVSYWINDTLWISIANSVAIVGLLIVTFFKVSRSNTFFVFALVVLHVNLVVYSVHGEQQERAGQQSKGRGVLSTIQHVYRITTAILSLFLMLSTGGNQIRTRKSTVNQTLALNTSKTQQDNRYVSSNKWIVYHIIMTLIAVSFPAIIYYQGHNMSESNCQFLSIGRLTWWISSILIYLWSILVQRIYPEQDLSELENYFKQFQLN